MGALKQLWNMSGGFLPETNLILSTGGINPIIAPDLNNFIQALKSDGTWNKIYFLHLPIIGYDEQSQKMNLVNPGTFDLVSMGTPGRSYNGIDFKSPNTTNYLKTGFVPNVNALNINDLSVIWYNNTYEHDPKYDFGFYNGGNQDFCIIDNGQSTASAFRLGGVNIAQTLADNRGFWVLNRSSINSLKLYKDKVEVGSNTTTNTGVLATGELYWGSINGLAGGYSSKIFKMGAVAKGLTVPQISNLNDSVLTLETSINNKLDFTYELWGDSITVGLNASPTSLGWASILSTDPTSPIFYGKYGYTPINHAVSGTAVSDFYTYAITQDQIPVYTGKKKFLFFAYGGMNDSTKGTSASTLGSTIASIVDYAISKGWPSNRIIILSLTYHEYSGFTESLSLAYVNASASVATSKGCQFVELYTTMKNNGGSSFVAADGNHIHPNNDGHAFILSQIKTQANFPSNY